MSQTRKRAREHDDTVQASPKRPKRTTSTAPASTVPGGFWHNVPRNVWQVLFGLAGFDCFIKYFSVLNKTIRSNAYNSIEELALTEDSVNFNDAKTLQAHITNMHNLTKLSLSGLDMLDDAGIAGVIEAAKSLHILRIHMLPLKKPMIKSATLHILVMSNCTSLDRLRVRCSALQQFEMYDCEQVKAPLMDTPQLHTIKFFSCNDIADDMLLSLLNHFDETPVVGKQSMNADSQDASEQQQRIVNKNLKTLWVADCAELAKPLIKLDSLEELRIINCKNLNQPFIRCINLKYLQVSWCESVEHIHLGCDNLKKIDLSGTAVKHDKGEVRENIIRALVQHFGDQITVTY